MPTLKQQITDEMKVAMKAKQKLRLGTIRMLMAAIKQREVDERIELDDAQVLAIIDKMVKQRRDAAKQYTDADRQDLADTEKAEIEVLQDFLPTPLTEAEITSLIEAAIAETGAAGMRDMGKVMGLVKPQVQGRADVGLVSGLVKQKLV
jgi:uncharacterized protein YqeY